MPDRPAPHPHGRGRRPRWPRSSRATSPRTDCRPTSPRSAEDAERRLAAGLRPDLVLLDINLPGETGWSLLRGQAYAAAGRPRVVVVSATRISSARLHEYDIAGYLPKPFAMETLLETVRRHTAEGADDGVATGPGGERMDVEIP